MEEIMTDNVLEVWASPGMPEEVTLHFTTTDFKGGNRRRGAEAKLEIIIGGGDHEVVVKNNDPRGKVVCITAQGDWEIGGLAEALVELGLKIWPLVHERKLKREKAEEEKAEKMLNEIGVDTKIPF
jgi:hypothetical protein